MKSRRATSIKRKRANKRKTKMRGGSIGAIPNVNLKDYTFRKVEGLPTKGEFYFTDPNGMTQVKLGKADDSGYSYYTILNVPEIQYHDFIRGDGKKTWYEAVQKT